MGMCSDFGRNDGEGEERKERKEGEENERWEGAVHMVSGGMMEKERYK